MKRYLPVFVASIVVGLSGIASHEAYAQLTPYLSQEGVPTADTWAKDALPDDRILIEISSFGGGGSSGLDLSSGTAPLWVYSYYSSSGSKLATVAVGSTMGLYEPLTSSIETVADAGDAPMLDLSAAYSGSDRMVEAIRGDSAYNAYAALHPGGTTIAAYLTNVPSYGTEGLPEDFPLDKPVWTVAFDTTLVCLVATGTGETVCLDVDKLTSAVPAELIVSGSMDVVPNPTAGITRVALTLPPGMHDMRRASVELFDTFGRRLLDLTGSFVRSGYRAAEFDASSLAPGVYYCRVTASGVQGVSRPIVVVR